ncbi:hypothetical protein P9B97_02220 [Bacillus paralicheniformis]|uniref:hypothetical protein n=1 Tax=Bacillus paralicheniformis TaxID=1648923 RepID=UPI002DBA4101|nr:hypothetical protein [Bacillus paralicheniformis]MEC1050900.1 hypothetical protein [Bacillus paralicheniformis]MEC1087725.1 hypothetical protein [Bacillus paralicheniformis]MEC1108794.1 hypothetical protein [Bacillus paralicheniformis]MEC1137151.1 hypothetical protein [Bacillus paralicheniformis]MEC1148439.1 hypothetical protein [Bacillus paralicheniformis]
MKHDELFLTVNWYKDDILKVFAKKGIPLTDTNFSKLKKLGATTLHGQSIENGWEILDTLVDIYEEELVPDEESFIIIEHEDRPFVLTYKMLSDYCTDKLNCTGNEFLLGYSWDDSKGLIDHLNLDEETCKAYLSESAFEYVTWIYYDGTDSEDLLEQKAIFLFEWLNIKVNGSVDLEKI